MEGYKKVVAGVCLLMVATAAKGQSLAYPDSLRAEKEDTLREITIEANKELKMPMSSSLKSSIQDIKNAEKYSLTNLLGGAADYILHPFGFAERKRARKRKKVNKVMMEYDAINDPLQELLDSVATVKGIEPKK